MRREKIFANHKSVKGVISKIIRNSYKSIANQFKKTKQKPNLIIPSQNGPRTGIAIS